MKDVSRSQAQRGFRPGSLVPALLALALTGAPGTAQTPSDPCITCHLEQDDERLSAPAVAFANDVHSERGFGCLACHGTLRGGSPDVAAGFLSAPARDEVPGLCASCHSDAQFMRDYNPNIRVDQFAEYATSVHGQLLLNSKDEEVATCTSCHPAHGILPPSDPESTVHPLNVAELCGSCHADEAIMAPRGHETTVLAEYQEGVHGQLMYEGGDVSAPTCNDCHGNHGAAPPGVGSVQNVCGQCHVGMAEFFDQSDHGEIFAERGLPGCATCHDNHRILPTNDQFLGGVSRDVCRRCHAEGDAYGGEFAEILEMLQSFEGEIAAAHESLDEAENMGMAVSQALFELEDVNNALTLSRTAVHAFKTEPVRLEVDKGREIVQRAAERAGGALEEHRDRRLGLTAATVLATLLVFGLWLRIRGFDLRLRRSTEAMRTFYHDHLAPDGPAVGLTGGRARLAAATLLLELAQSDVPDAAKRVYLGDVLRRETGSPSLTDELIELAKRQRVEAMDIGQITQVMTAGYTHAQRVESVEALWAIVLSDPELARLQGRFLNRVPEVFELSREELVSALERVHNHSVAG
jgi:predicted CXXCH cytochrome family protein